MTEQELYAILDPKYHTRVCSWLDRGDGVAVYQNLTLDSASVGHRQFVSYGSPAAQLEMDEPPMQMPDIGGQINWRYQLEGTVRRSKEQDS